MPQWAAFVGITGVVLVLLLVLSRLTQSSFSDGDLGSDEESDRSSEPPVDGDADRADIAVDIPTENAESSRSKRGETNSDSANVPARDPAEGTRVADNSSRPRSSSSATETIDSDDRNERTAADQTAPPRDSRPERDPAAADVDRRRPADRGVDPDSLSTGMVLANVAFSQGLFALVLLGAAVYTAIPASALGIEFSVSALETGLLWGAAAGIVFYLANELAAAIATHLGFDHEEDLRELLSPDSIGGWLLLLGGVLPIIAVFEEFLFRAAMIGVPAAGFGVSPWLLAVVSSIAFALGHGMQGSIGVVVTGLLGFVLAAVFIVTGSFLVVVVAHYLVNALEFVVHEGLGLEWAETLEG
ncbi:CPBP family intramembrane glutamic endopeptidase [Natrinema versiforme]|uniref:Abortive infection protein n=1 Tax=Natrinema versiforme JCM 10478 TaxID=1227496 RepID=L9YB01_9EURY|nr:type II CAAX endopeptidase family protein [Natrinema versiforme]ELY70897.1 Abortive infection protein [Natrinema versiforme JCM 10478]